MSKAIQKTFWKSSFTSDRRIHAL